MKCQKCEKEAFLPFRCPYCGEHFCSEHRLPENHDCLGIEIARAKERDAANNRSKTRTVRIRDYVYAVWNKEKNKLQREGS